MYVKNYLHGKFMINFLQIFFIIYNFFYVYRGIAEGHLSKDFKILTNGQCLPNGSYENALYDDVKNWDNFHNVHNENKS